MTSWSTFFSSAYRGPLGQPKLPPNLIPPYALQKECVDLDWKYPNIHHYPMVEGIVKHLPPTPELQYTCDSCHTVLIKVLRCSRCHKVYYCNTTCQTTDWMTHKSKCAKK